MVVCGGCNTLMKHEAKGLCRRCYFRILAQRDDIKAKRKARYEEQKPVIVAQMKQYRESHKEEISARRQRVYRMSPATNHARRLIRDFGPDAPQFYSEAFERQGGCCDICGKHQSQLSRQLALDHDHITGQFRGLLCGGCNHRLADSEWMRKAQLYLNRATGGTYIQPPLI